MPNLVDPLRCFGSGRGTEEAVVEEIATAVLDAFSFKGDPCDASFEIQVVSQITGGIGHNLKRGRLGQYVLSYQPTVKGRHQLHIKAHGQHIRESPFTVIVKLPVEKLGNAIQVWRGLEPYAVAIGWKGMVVVVNTSCVSLFSRGVKLRSFGVRGYDKG